MVITWSQKLTPGGHVLRAETEVADGHLEIEATFTSVYIEGEVPGEPEWVGQVATERRAWINGSLVLDPAYAQQLLDEAIRP